MKGVVIMTLRELIIKCGIETNLALGGLGNLKVYNESEFCRFALKKYFWSDKFVKDIALCKLDYDEKKYNGSYCYIFINRDSSGFSISVENELEPPYSFD